MPIKELPRTKRCYTMLQTNIPKHHDENCRLLVGQLILIVRRILGQFVRIVEVENCRI